MLILAKNSEIMLLLFTWKFDKNTLITTQQTTVNNPLSLFTSRNFRIVNNPLFDTV